MAHRRTLGYIQLEWVCPNCGTRNPGLKKTCENCGTPQPENVEFVQPAEQKFITDADELKAAQAGADIHCGFCGTRNPATATVCSQCGADLKEGRARQAGRVMDAPPTAPRTVTCTNCGSVNPSSERTCSNCGSPLPRAISPSSAIAAQPGGKAAGKKRNWLLLGGIGAALLMFCIAAVLLFLLPASSVQATVTGVHWKTYVPVEALHAVNYTDQRGSPPADAYNVSCRDESREVCEQKTIDRGNGVAEVVEECRTETEQYCSYTRDEWETVQTYTLDGNDLRPVYSEPTIAGSGQRIGAPSEDLVVYFDTPKGPKTYSPDTVSEFQQFAIGSVWTLKLNALGGIVNVER